MQTNRGYNGGTANGVLENLTMQERPGSGTSPSPVSASKTSDGVTGRAPLKRFLPLILVLAVSMAGIAAWSLDIISLSAIIRHREALSALISDNPVVSIIVYVVTYSIAVAVSFPGASFLTIFGGFLFGWLAGGLMTVVGATVGATVLFLIARSSLGATYRERAGPFLAQFAEGVRRNAVSYLLFLRLTPIFPFWLVNLAPALFNVPLSTYVVTTAAGIIPGTFAYAVFGSGLDSVISAQEAANPGCAAAGTCAIDASAILTPELIIALAILGLVSLLPVALRAWRGHRDA